MNQRLARESRISFLSEKTVSKLGRSTGVSLHGHTLYSQEPLDFIDRAIGSVPLLAPLIRNEKARYHRSQGSHLNLRNAWWTPPLGPRQAWDLERKQIHDALGLAALVSLSDHDNIDAGLNLQVREDSRFAPISIEWTVPFRQTFFHVGVHNLPPEAAIAMSRAMMEFTAAPEESDVAPLLEHVGASGDTLLVLNHPMWDESHIGEALHLECLEQFLSSFHPFLHGLELNGLRPWGENRKTLQMAERFRLLAVSGGDRHGREPNACLNLTDAKTFCQFAAELRDGAASEVVFLPHYGASLKRRVVESVIDVLADDANHALGWNHWSDRVFYRNNDGVVQSLRDLWGGQTPRVVRRFEAVKRFVESGRVRSLLRYVPGATGCRSLSRTLKPGPAH